MDQRDGRGHFKNPEVIWKSGLGTRSPCRQHSQEIHKTYRPIAVDVPRT